MLHRIFPERVADRLILRVTDVLDEFPTLSPFARGAMIDWLELLAEEEGYTPASKEAATYAMHVGYAVRGIEVADGKARDLDESLLARLEQVRREAPDRHKAELRATVESPETDEVTRELFQRWLDDDAPYSWEREVLDALIAEVLIAEAVRDRWMEDEPRFLRLSEYSWNVWRIFLMKLTGTLNNQLPSNENVFPWQHVLQLVWLGYLLRVGDAVNGWS